MKKIVCFGDSLSEGWYNDGRSFHPFTSRLSTLVNKEKESGFNIINAGISGETITKEMTKRLPKCLNLHKEINILIIQGGTNDILQFSNFQTDLDLFEQLENLLNIVFDYNVCKVLLLTTLEGYFTEKDEAVMDNDTSSQIREKFNRKIVEKYDDSQHRNGMADLRVCDIAKEFPLFSLTKEDKELLWDDDLHPTPHGYDVMASIIYKHLVNFEWL